MEKNMKPKAKDNKKKQPALAGGVAAVAGAGVGAAAFMGTAAAMGQDSDLEGELIDEDTATGEDLPEGNQTSGNHGGHSNSGNSAGTSTPSDNYGTPQANDSAEADTDENDPNDMAAEDEIDVIVETEPFDPNEIMLSPDELDIVIAEPTDDFAPVTAETAGTEIAVAPAEELYDPTGDLPEDQLGYEPAIDENLIDGYDNFGMDTADAGTAMDDDLAADLSADLF